MRPANVYLSAGRAPIQAMPESIRSSLPPGAARTAATSISLRLARSGTRSTPDIHSSVFPERPSGFPPRLRDDPPAPRLRVRPSRRRNFPVEACRLSRASPRRQAFRPKPRRVRSMPSCSLRDPVPFRIIELAMTTNFLAAGTTTTSRVFWHPAAASRRPPEPDSARWPRSSPGRNRPLASPAADDAALALPFSRRCGRRAPGQPERRH